MQQKIHIATPVRSQPWLHAPGSLAFRLALVYGVVFVASAALLFLVIAYISISTLVDQRDRAITSELNELRAEASREGVDEIRSEITARDSADNKSQFIYGLFDQTGNSIAGTKLKVPRRSGWSDVDTPTGDPDDEFHQIHFRSEILSNGNLLSVGEDTDPIDDVGEFLTKAFLIGLAGAIALAIAGAFVVRWVFLTRLDRVAAVCREIMAGNLALRVPMTAGDEINVLAQSLNAMLDRIVALMATLQQVTVDIAHDLRTPLTRVRQGLEAAKLRGPSGDDNAATIQKAVRDIDVVLETFAALLRIAELQGGSLRATFKPVDLSATLQSIAEAYTPSVEESGQHLETHIDPGIVVSGDENLITQMIANLLANALRHTPAGTVVRVELQANAGHPVATVSDNGPGIPEADRNRVFGRFVRLERSRSTPGTGLGLSVAAAIAELHGVHIALEDNHPGLLCRLSFP